MQYSWRPLFSSTELSTQPHTMQDDYHASNYSNRVDMNDIHQTWAGPGHTGRQTPTLVEESGGTPPRAIFKHCG